MAENEALKDQVQELSIDLDIIKNEISESGEHINTISATRVCLCACVCMHMPVYVYLIVTDALSLLLVCVL